jgi:phosphoribosylanthranilate isomerase
VSAERAAELARRLPAFVTPVLLLVNASLAEVAQACALVANATLQFHGDETPEDCLVASGKGARPYLRAARIPIGPVAEAFNLLKYANDFSTAQALLLDAHVEGYGGGGKAFDWSLLPPNVGAHLVLSGGLDSANVGDGIAQVRPRCKSLAVDVSSGVEAMDASGKLRKGIKDPDKIFQFVAAVRAADQQLAGVT